MLLQRLQCRGLLKWKYLWILLPLLILQLWCMGSLLVVRSGQSDTQSTSTFLSAKGARDNNVRNKFQQYHDYNEEIDVNKEELGRKLSRDYDRRPIRPDEYSGHRPIIENEPYDSEEILSTTTEDVDQIKDFFSRRSRIADLRPMVVGDAMESKPVVDYDDEIHFSTTPTVATTSATRILATRQKEIHAAEKLRPIHLQYGKREPQPYLLNTYQEIQTSNANSSQIDSNASKGPLNTFKITESPTTSTESYLGDCQMSPISPENVTIADGEWLAVPDRPIYVYSAYFDDRTSVGGPLVRIVALGLQKKFNPIDELFCLYDLSHHKLSLSVQANYSDVYPSLMWPDEYTTHWITCPYPEHYIEKYGKPKSVSVLPIPCQDPSHRLTVNYAPRELPHTGIGLCLPAMYRTTDWVGIAEWIAIHKLLGYKTIVAYNDSIPTGPASKVLNVFATGYDPDIRVIILPWNLPDVKRFYFGQHACINDCLYRTGLLHQYATVSDKDEIIMSLSTNHIQDLIRKLEKEDSGAYMFQHIMFDAYKTDELDNQTFARLNLERFNQSTLQLTSLTHRFHMSEPHPPGKIRSKTVYNVERTISADIHFPRQMAPGYRELMVAPSEGVVYHYKTNPSTKWLNDVEYEHESKLDIFKDKLLTEVANIAKHLDLQ